MRRIEVRGRARLCGAPGSFVRLLGVLQSTQDSACPNGRDRSKITSAEPSFQMASDGADLNGGFPRTKNPLLQMLFEKETSDLSSPGVQCTTGSSPSTSFSSQSSMTAAVAARQAWRHRKRCEPPEKDLQDPYAIDSIEEKLARIRSPVKDEREVSITKPLELRDGVDTETSLIFHRFSAAVGRSHRICSLVDAVARP